jgi:hypothetical protein
MGGKNVEWPQEQYEIFSAYEEKKIESTKTREAEKLL